MRYITVVMTVLFAVLVAHAEVPRRINWSWGPVLPTPKDALTTTVVGDLIVTVGGTNWVNTETGDTVKQWLSSVYQFDTQEMRWTALPDYPLPVGFAFAASVGNKLYVCGGVNADRVHSETFVLDLSKPNPTWVAGPALPLPRNRDLGGVIDGVIYIAGGFEADPTRQGSTRPASAVLALDTRHPEAGWRYVADVVHPETNRHAIAVSGGKLYMFGGQRTIPAKGDQAGGPVVRATHNLVSAMPQAEALALDVATGRWQTLRPLPVPTVRAGCASIDDNHIIIAGGMGLARCPTRDGKPRLYFSSQCLLYDTVRDRYTPLTPLKQAVLGHGFVCVKGTVYTIGGEDSSYRTRTDHVQIGKLR